MAAVPASVLLSQVGIAKAAPGKKGVLLMNRIAPSQSALYTAGADGAGERKLLADSAYDYNVTLSPKGDRIIFTSERNGDGQSDLFIALPDGSGIRQLAQQRLVHHRDVRLDAPDGLIELC